MNKSNRDCKKIEQWNLKEFLSEVLSESPYLSNFDLSTVSKYLVSPQWS